MANMIKREREIERSRERGDYGAGWRLELESCFKFCKSSVLNRVYLRVMIRNASGQLYNCELLQK